jgi:hypothetical protein
LCNSYGAFFLVDASADVKVHIEIITPQENWDDSWCIIHG